MLADRDETMPSVVARPYLSDIEFEAQHSCRHVLLAAFDARTDRCIGVGPALLHLVSVLDESAFYVGRMPLRGSRFPAKFAGGFGRQSWGLNPSAPRGVESWGVACSGVTQLYLVA